MIKKTAVSAGDSFKKTEVKDEQLRFSFRYFTNDAELSPRKHQDSYTQKLAERLKELSGWTVQRFTGPTLPEVKNHRITWAQTSRHAGFEHLDKQLRQGEAWQFSVTRNSHGRVHGLLIGDTFYVVWLDTDHRLYPA